MQTLSYSYAPTTSQLFSRKIITALMIVAAHVVLLLSIMLIKTTTTSIIAPKEIFMSVITNKLSKPEPVIIVNAKTLPPPNQVFVPAPETIVAPVQNPSTILATTATPPAEVIVKNIVTAPISAPVITKEQSGPKVVSAVEYVHAPRADYPSIAKRMGEEGRVVMQVLVNEKGRAEKVDVVQSSGFKRLDEAAKLALMRALFKPYFEDGKAGAMLATASINFSLRS
jgi:protein TonB